MQTFKARCVFDGKATLGEGPGWDEQRQALVWVDIEQGKICRFYPGQQRNVCWSAGQREGFVVQTQTDALLAGGQQGLFLLDPSSGQLQKLEHPEAHLPDNRFNDAKCDPQGRLWAGTMSCLETAGVGHLYCMDLEGKVSAQLDGITISNGLAWSQDQRTMYYIDTPTRRIDALDFDSETGSISQRRSAFEIPDGMGYPDGMTIDAQGRLWVALWAGWGVGCWDPTSGELLGKVELPVECVTSCCFGGPDYQTLYITTASRDLDKEGWVQQPLAGGLFAAEVGVGGGASQVYQGRL